MAEEQKVASDHDDEQDGDMLVLGVLGRGSRQGKTIQGKSRERPWRYHWDASAGESRWVRGRSLLQRSTLAESAVPFADPIRTFALVSTAGSFSILQPHLASA
jgi:hypothetical protein